LSWRDRLDQQPRLWDFAEWPVVSKDEVDEDFQNDFQRNKEIVAQVLDGQTLKAVGRAHGLSAQRMGQLLKRCLGGLDSEAPALTRGLIPYKNVTRKHRTQALATLATPAGSVGAFHALLEEVPAIKAGLDATIEAHFKDSRYGQRLTPQFLHKKFINLLGEHHWPQNRYPNTDASRAYQSVRRYLQEHLMELERDRQLRRQRPRLQRLATDPHRRAQRVTQIDEHVVDLRTVVHLILNGGLRRLPLARPNLLLAVDRDTTCVLAYFLAPTRHPNQQDMLTLLERCLSSGPLPSLTTPGMHYVPGAGFPGTFEDAYPVSFGTVQLDNALMHRAESVVAFLCDECGAALSYGPPATPTVRHEVESIFRWIARNLTHRPASTTGSHPNDPKRESRKNQKELPAVTFQALDEALCVKLTEYNVTPQASLQGATPLELFRAQCTAHHVRYVPAMLARTWDPLRGKATRDIQWNENERRAPYVFFLGARYYGPGLIRVAGKVRQAVLRFDRRDIRILRASTPEGTDLGELQVANPWRRYPHSFATRKLINRLVAGHRLRKRDPVAGYFDLVSASAKDPTGNQDLYRVALEFSQNQQELPADDVPAEDVPAEDAPSTIPPPPTRPEPPREQFTWRSHQANHRIPR
jgi:hypothetical protein